ncbi:hypothetical protein DUNSADRAFT_6388, partial [Dunaliella salina]
SEQGLTREIPAIHAGLLCRCPEKWMLLLLGMTRKWRRSASRSRRSWSKLPIGPLQRGCSACGSRPVETPAEPSKHLQPLSQQVRSLLRDESYEP